MEYNINDITITKEDFVKYINTSINKLFALLGIYEDCESNNNFDNYTIYLNRILTEFNGIYYLCGSVPFMSIVGILKGMSEFKELDHKKVKSLVFHCISILKKAR